jgi:hypothetical protein
MSLKTRLQRAERAASANDQDDYSAAIEAHRQEILARIESGKCGIFENAEWDREPDPAEQERLIKAANAAVKAIVEERRKTQWASKLD